MSERAFRNPYPDYDVLAKWDTPSWNDQTRAVIARRLTEVPARRFLSELQFATLQAVCDRVMPQPERTGDDKVPIAPFIDARLQNNRTSGTRYVPLPPMRECWQRGLDAIEAEAQHRFHRSYAALDPAEQDLILHAMNKGETLSPAWGPHLPAQKFMRHELLQVIVETYYAHPAAWSEVGFGGPASPRGYVRLQPNRHDSWEGEERDTTFVRAAAAK
jgi:hypothetical protein